MLSARCYTRCGVLFIDAGSPVLGAINAKVLHTFVLYAAIFGVGWIVNNMGKAFLIISIRQGKDFAKAILQSISDEKDTRYVILEPFPAIQNAAKGIEYNADYSLLLPGIGYLLLGKSPLSQWQDNDTVTELLYPEDIDER